MTDQLHHDLRNQIVELHNRWLRDSVSLYRMAGLKPHHFARDASAVLAEAMFCVLDGNVERIDELFDALRKVLKEAAAKQ